MFGLLNRNTKTATFVIVDGNNKVVRTANSLDAAFASRKAGQSVKMAADWRRGAR